MTMTHYAINVETNHPDAQEIISRAAHDIAEALDHQGEYESEVTAAFFEDGREVNRFCDFSLEPTEEQGR